VKAASSINAPAKTNSKRNGRHVLNFRMCPSKLEELRPL
jgi:hypothetical protein